MSSKLSACVIVEKLIDNDVYVSVNTGAEGVAEPALRVSIGSPQAAGAGGAGTPTGAGEAGPPVSGPPASARRPKPWGYSGISSLVSS